MGIKAKGGTSKNMKVPSYEDKLLDLKRFKIEFQCPLNFCYVTAKNFKEAKKIISNMQFFEYWIDFGNYKKGLSSTITRKSCRIPIKY